MNITLIVTIILFIYYIIRGYNKGMTRVVSDFVALIVVLISLVDLWFIYIALKNDNVGITILLIIGLILLGLLYGIVQIPIKSIHNLMKLPALHLLDQVLGLCVGCFCALAILWIVFILCDMGILGSVGITIQEQVKENVVLTMLYEYNYFKGLY
ncbi:MAG: hypothetical protein R3Y24_04915 [Eubacteriales bacterium]